MIVLCGQLLIRSLSPISSISGMDCSDSLLCYDIPFRIEFAECISFKSMSLIVKGPLVTGLTEKSFFYTSGGPIAYVSFISLFSFNVCSPFSKSASGSFIFVFTNTIFQVRLIYK